VLFSFETNASGLRARSGDVCRGVEGVFGKSERKGLEAILSGLSGTLRREELCGPNC